MDLFLRSLTSSVSSSPAIDVTLSALRFDVTLSATATALYITLTTLAHGRFSDNFFAMGAGSKRTIQFVPFSTFSPSMLAPSLRVEHLQMYLGSSAAGAEIL